MSRNLCRVNLRSIDRLLYVCPPIPLQEILYTLRFSYPNKAAGDGTCHAPKVTRS
jgi:hypothetical protein